MTGTVERCHWTSGSGKLRHFGPLWPHMDFMHRVDLPCSDSPATADFSGSVSSERRATKRMPIERAVRYRMLGGKRTTGSGTTLNMSSSGILFTTESGLGSGQRVELSVSWPARLDDRVPLQLVTVGRLVRVQAGHAAVAIERWVFKTCRSTGPAPVSPSTYVSTSRETAVNGVTNENRVAHKRQV